MSTLAEQVEIAKDIVSAFEDCLDFHETANTAANLLLSAIGTERFEREARTWIKVFTQDVDAAQFLSSESEHKAIMAAEALNMWID